MSNDDLLIAANTIWVVVAAILVMFMQAGFAFLEAGLTRMKNVGHIAAKNVLVLGIASIVYYLVGFGIAFGDGGNGLFGGSGFAPGVDTLLAIGAAPFSWFGTVPAVPDACEGNELLGPDGCANNGSESFDEILFWKTPTDDCNGTASLGSCVPYYRWVTDYLAVIGGR